MELFRYLKTLSMFGRRIKLEKLNLRTPKPYDYSNESASMKYRSKFYCVSEGATEESYFYGIKNNKVELGIKNDIYIEVVEKEEGQESFSHPVQLVKACLYNMGRVDEFGEEIPQAEWGINCKWRDYDPEYDTVCVIFDRDYRKLKIYLEELFNICKKHNIYIAISNPNFELWLLMHFPGIEKYDKNKLLKNPKNLRGELFSDASKKKKYLEILVSKLSHGYSKGSKIKFERFSSGVQLAINQAGLFCEDFEMLSENLGTTVGKLLRKMQE